MTKSRLHAIIILSIRNLLLIFNKSEDKVIKIMFDDIFAIRRQAVDYINMTWKKGGESNGHSRVLAAVLADVKTAVFMCFIGAF